jgi:hypothetical protein
MRDHLCVAVTRNRRGGLSLSPHTGDEAYYKDCRDDENG